MFAKTVEHTLELLISALISALRSFDFESETTDTDRILQEEIQYVKWVTMNQHSQNQSDPNDKSIQRRRLKRLRDTEYEDNNSDTLNHRNKNEQSSAIHSLTKNADSSIAASSHLTVSSPSSVSSSRPIDIPSPPSSQQNVPLLKRKRNLHPVSIDQRKLPSIRPSISTSTTTLLPNNSFSYSSSNPSSSSSSFSITEDKVNESTFYHDILCWDIFQPHQHDHASSSMNISDPFLQLDPTTIRSKTITFPDPSFYRSFFLPLLLRDFRFHLRQSFLANLEAPHSLLPSLTLSRVISDSDGDSDNLYTIELTNHHHHHHRKQQHSSSSPSPTPTSLTETTSVNAESQQQSAKEIETQKNEARRLKNILESWSSGDFGYLRYHQKRDDKVYSQMVCLIDRVEILNSSLVAHIFTIRIKIMLPKVGKGKVPIPSPSSLSSSSPSSPSVSTCANPDAPQARHQRMFEVLMYHKEKDSSSLSTRFSSSRIPDGYFTVVHLSSPVTTLREYIALQHISSLKLLPHLLNPSIHNKTNITTNNTKNNDVDCNDNISFEMEKEKNWMTMPESFRSFLISSLNEFQLESIKVTSYRTTQPGFTLLQGPPGTGKTKTVVSLLNSLHLRTYQAHYESLIQSLLRKKQSHTSSISSLTSESPPLSSSSSLHSLLSSISSSATSSKLSNDKPILAAKPRFLVCAPSNTGVDEIISRVLQKPQSSSSMLRGQGGFVDGHFQCYAPNIVRIGTSENIRPEVRNKISLDALVDQYMKLSYDQLIARERDASQYLFQQEKALKHQIKIYRSRHDSPTPISIHSSSAPNPALVGEIARLHERVHLTKTDLDRCRSLLSFFTPDANGMQSLPLRNKQPAIDKLRLSFLNEAHLVFCTLSGAGLDLLSDLEQPFQTLLVDEAAQATELATLVALRHNVSHCVLVGDPKQLPATVFTHDKEGIYREMTERSLFERLASAGIEVLALLTQYRMHPEIRKFPSQHFYENLLQDGENVTGPSWQQLFHSHPLFRPFVFFDVSSSSLTKVVDPIALSKFQRRFPHIGGRSSSNALEAAVIFQMITLLLELFPHIKPQQIGVITFYQNQKKILEDLGSEEAKKWAANKAKDDADEEVTVIEKAGDAVLLPHVSHPTSLVEISTVDGFQGREKDIILVSCVRSMKSQGSKSMSRNSIGFVSDVRRLNVALTRAKFGLWMIGDSQLLSRGSIHWAVKKAEKVKINKYKEAIRANAVNFFLL